VGLAPLQQLLHVVRSRDHSAVARVEAAVALLVGIDGKGRAGGGGGSVGEELDVLDALMDELAAKASRTGPLTTVFVFIVTFIFGLLSAWTVLPDLDACFRLGG
jgi:hypothetical protein